MANITDYLSWRGDLTLSRDPFNEVDNLLLCTLAYTDFDDVVPGLASPETITLREAAQKYFSIHTEEEIRQRTGFTSQVPLLILRQMGDSGRFGEVRLGGYFNMVDRSSEAQISVLTYFLSDGSIFVAFRGTDNSIAGWKEDFNLSFSERTPGQQMAVSYLNHLMREYGGTIRLGGHSKGGNFAVFAAAFCEEPFRERIIEIWNNDGPGFIEEVIQTPEFAMALPKIRNILPEGSVFGLLLHNPAPRKIIVSAKSGIWQHDTLSWQVYRTGLVETESLSEKSIYLEKIFTEWLDRITPSERRVFVDTVFDVAAAGDKKISEIDTSLKGYGNILKAISKLPRERQEVLKTTLTALIKSSAETLIQPIAGKFDEWIGKAAEISGSVEEESSDEKQAP